MCVSFALFCVPAIIEPTCSADYAASKAALINLHESLRYELDKRYVLVFHHPFIIQVPAFFFQLQNPQYSYHTRRAGPHNDKAVLADVSPYRRVVQISGAIYSSPCHCKGCDCRIG